jgi:hypothetical protein
MKRVLIAPRIAGLRAHKGAIMLNPDGSQVKTVRPAILPMPCTSG